MSTDDTGATDRPAPPVDLPARREIAVGQLEAIVAVGPHGLIGHENRLPWHAPVDMAMFRSLTWGKTLLIGSATWVSIGRALPGRNIAVVSRKSDPGNLPETVVWMPGIEASDRWAAHTGRPLIVAGGAQIYALAAPRIGCWWQTELAGPGIQCADGAATIPALDRNEWCETWRSRQVQERDLSVTFTRWNRRQPSSS